MDLSKLFYLITGGTLGTIARYVLAGWVYKITGASFPYGTLAVNGLGCFIIGFLAGISEKKFLLGSDMKLFLMIGFCGAFTTFSTFMLETDHLIKDGEMFGALLNVLLSVLIGFIVFRLGFVIAEMI